MKKFTALMLSAAMLATYAFNASAAVTYKEYADGDVITTNKYADSKYVFDVDGEKFTLLDTFDSTTSKYLVIANKSYGQRTVKEDSFTSEKSSAVQNWLNGDFIAKTNASRLNDDIISHIDFNHVWSFDPSLNLPEGTTVTAGITLPSVSEMAEYGNKMGYADPGEGYATRTQIAGESDDCVVEYEYGVSDKSATSWKITGTDMTYTGIRPIFCLNDSFFAEKAIDLTKAGDEVKAEIKKIDVSKLLGIYDATYLINNLGIAPPDGYIMLRDVKIKTLSGETVKNGETLLPKFKYDSSNENDFASASYVWERIDEKGNATKVGTGDKYIVTEEDTIGGKNTIRFKVTVTDTEGNSTEHTSEKTTVIPAIVTKVWKPSTENIHAPMNTEDMSYKFTVGDQVFVMVDVFNNDKSTFFIVPDGIVKTRMTHPYFDPTDEASVAYKMNTTFVNEGLGDESMVLPDDIIKYIDFDHMWVCEAAPENIDERVHESYAFKAGVTLLSFTEIQKYSSIIATVNNIKGFSRSAANYASPTKPEMPYIYYINWRDNNTNIWTNVWDTDGNLYSAKPALYLGKDFFKNVKIDLATVGTEALKMLKKVYNVEDLAGLYSVETLEEMGFNHNYSLSATFGGKTGGEATLSGTLTSNVEGEHSKVLILSICDADGIAVASKAQKIDFDGKETKSISISAGTLPEGTYTAKAMLWDNLYDANAEMTCITY